MLHTKFHALVFLNYVYFYAVKRICCIAKKTLFEYSHAPTLISIVKFSRS